MDFVKKIAVIVVAVILGNWVWSKVGGSLP